MTSFIPTYNWTSLPQIARPVSNLRCDQQHCRMLVSLTPDIWDRISVCATLKIVRTKEWFKTAKTDFKKFWGWQRKKRIVLSFEQIFLMLIKNSIFGRVLVNFKQIQDIVLVCSFSTLKMFFAWWIESMEIPISWIISLPSLVFFALLDLLGVCEVSINEKNYMARHMGIYMGTHVLHHTIAYAVLRYA